MTDRTKRSCIRYCALAVLIIAQVITLPAVAIGCSKGKAAPAVGGSVKRLAVSGRLIVGRDGKPVKLRGIYTRATWLDSENEVERFSEWGINFVRILLTHNDDYWQVVNNGKIDPAKRCVVPEENLLHMDERVRWLERRQIYFIMEIHWRALGIDEKFTKPELLKRQIAAMYAMLAKRYKGFGYLMGFCMFSEIYVAPRFYSVYNDICTAVVDAVHGVDPSFIVSATGVQTSSPDSLKDVVHINRPNVIYDFHYYAPKMFTHYRKYYGDLRYPGWVADGWAPGVELIDMDYLRRHLQPVLSFSKKWNVPAWCGEFGAFGSAPDGSSPRWERDVYRLFEQNNIPWILWCWRQKKKAAPEHWKAFWKGTAETSYVTIVPHGGPFAGRAMVKLDCTVDNATIRYTLDGVEPDEHSALYCRPFEIGHGVTVKAAAFENARMLTAVDSATFYDIAPREPRDVENIAPGLTYSYYQGASEQIENFEQLKPVKTGIAKTFGLNGADRDDCIALKFEGFLEVPADGMYYFYTSDAGASSLWIGDVLVVDNPESRWLSRRSGFMALKAGKHEIRATYRRADKAEVFYSKEKRKEWFMVEYEGPGIKRQPIPKAVLWHAAKLTR